MTPLEKLEALAADLEFRDAGRSDDMCVPPSIRLRSILAELRPYFEPSGVPEDSAPANSQHFKTWVAIMDALDGSGFDWRPRTPQTCAKDAAVAAIRSMAAQCSAQLAPAIPIAWPEPIASEQLSALVWAQGYLSGTGYDRVVESLEQIESWLRKNGCDQIR